MIRPGFLDVSAIGPSHFPTQSDAGMCDGVLIRDYSGKIIEGLLITPDGHFRSSMGKVHREDVGEFVIRCSGHPSRGHLDEQPLAPQARKA